MLTESTQQFTIRFFLPLGKLETGNEGLDGTEWALSEKNRLNPRLESAPIAFGKIVSDLLEFLAEGWSPSSDDVYLRDSNVPKGMRAVPKSFYLRYLPQNKYETSKWQVGAVPNLWFCQTPTFVVLLHFKVNGTPKEEWGFAFKGQESYIEQPLPKGFEVLEDGIIEVKMERLSIKPGDPCWPYVIADPGFYLAIAKINKMLTPYHSRPLTMLMADKQPNKGIGTGIVDELKEVLDYLWESAPKRFFNR